jgi:hypothetical protein
MFRYLIAILFFCQLALQAQAQIVPGRTGNPPLLQCVKKEPANQIQIQWTAAGDVGPCFQQYAIYLSKGDRQGPYEKVDSVAGSGSGFLVIDPSFAGDVYVFMVNEQNCNNPAPLQLSSDTLDNIVPQRAIDIINLTVENNRPVINWVPASNPEVAAYVMYSNVNNFNTPIDTVFGRLSSSWADVSADPSAEIAVYRIRALEFCESDTGLLGNITPSYNTIRVQAGPEEPCARAVTLTWNGYNNQGNGVQGYAVEFSTDAGNTFSVRETLPEAARTFVYDGLAVGSVTCIRISAILPDGLVSNSNLLCLVGAGVAPVEVHYIQNISVGADAVDIEYIADPNADYDELVLERSTNGQVFNVLTSAVSIQQPVPGGPFIIRDFSALTDRTAYWYRVSARNICNDTYSTLPTKTVFLEGQNNGLDNSLSWTDFLIDLAELNDYDLLRIEDGDTTVIFSGDALAYNDQGVYAGDRFGNSCYVIRHRFEFDDADRPTGERSGFSNTVCLQPRPQAFVPNAFAPSGTNRVFRPILTFSKTDNYFFEVFNRNGEKVFSSNRPGQGWDGIYKNAPAPLDSYIYYLRFTGVDDIEYTRTGFVLLVK